MPRLGYPAYDRDDYFAHSGYHSKSLNPVHILIPKAFLIIYIMQTSELWIEERLGDFKLQESIQFNYASSNNIHLNLYPVIVATFAVLYSPLIINASTGTLHFTSQT